MKQLWAEIDQIIEEGTPHRRGYTLKESTFPATVTHMKEEVVELETSVTPDERVNELGDVLAIVFHAAKQLGLTMEQLEEVALKKLKMRFPGHEPKPAPQLPSTYVVAEDRKTGNSWIIPRNPRGVMGINVTHFDLILEGAGIVPPYPDGTVLKLTIEQVPFLPKAVMEGHPELAEALDILTEVGVKIG